MAIKIRTLQVPVSESRLANDIRLITEIDNDIQRACAFHLEQYNRRHRGQMSADEAAEYDAYWKARAKDLEDDDEDNDIEDSYANLP